MNERIKIIIYKCKFMAGRRCGYSGKQPTGVNFLTLTGERNCGVMVGAIQNLEKSDIGKLPEYVLKDEVDAYISPNGMLT